MDANTWPKNTMISTMFASFSERPLPTASSDWVALSGLSRGASLLSLTVTWNSPSPNGLHLGVQPDRDEVDDEIDDEHQREGHDDRPVHRPPDPGGTARGVEPHVRADDPDHVADDRAFEQRDHDLDHGEVRVHGGEVLAGRHGAVGDGADQGAHHADQHRDDHQQWGENRDGHHPGQHQLADRVGTEHLQGVQLLADLAG